MEYLLGCAKPRQRHGCLDLPVETALFERDAEESSSALQ
jgi:hypothetical protein